MPNDLAERINACRKLIAESVANEAADMVALRAHYDEQYWVLEEQGVPADPVSSLNSMVADVEAVKARHRENRQMLERQFAELMAECAHIALIGLTAGAICPTCGTTF